MFRAHQEYQEHPEGWLKAVDGTLDKNGETLKRYDLSNADVRIWWTDVARKAVNEGTCDGGYMDAIPQIVAAENRRLWGLEKYEAIQQGLRAMVRDGWTLSRRFQHLSVRVNLETQEAGIQWHGATDQKTGQQDRATRATRGSKYQETGGERNLEVLYKQAGGQDVHLDLYYPTVKRTKKCQVILFTHGGGWAAGSRTKAANDLFGSARLVE